MSVSNECEFGATRRAFVVGGIASGVLAATRPALAQVPADTAGATALPPAPSDQTADVLHGISVPDPFRPLEDVERADVKAWIAAQDQRARAYLATPTRDKARKFLDLLLDYSRTSIPAQHGTRYFSFFNDGLANQRSYGVQDHFGGPRRTLIDAATLSSDGTVSISGAYPDRRGIRVAYLISEAGSDKQTLKVRDVDTGRDLRDTLQWCKHTSVAWFPNGRGFYYTRYPGDKDPPDWDRHSQIVCAHIVGIGQDQSNDRVVFRRPELKDVYCHIWTSFDARLLRIAVHTGTSEKAGYYVAPIDDVTQVTEMMPVGVAGFWPIGNVSATHYAITNLDAPKWRLVRIDQSDPKPDRWHTVIPEERPPARLRHRVRQPAGREASRQSQQPRLGLRYRRPQVVDHGFRRPGAGVVRASQPDRRPSAARS